MKISSLNILINHESVLNKKFYFISGNEKTLMEKIKTIIVEVFKEKENVQIKNINTISDFVDEVGLFGDKNIYIVLGDAELYEGAVWETMMYITHHKLNNVKLIIDRNGLGILGATEELLKLEPLADKFTSFGFDTCEIDGHNYDELREAFNKQSDRPVAIIANTIKGKGVSYMEGKWQYHTIIPKSDKDINTGLKELS